MGIKVDIKRKLGEFSLDIHFQTESKRIGILGASGCGKSMTLKSIAGIETPDFGMIQIDDKVLFDSANKVDLKPQKRNVGYLFQNYALFPTMTVAKNIAAGLKGSKEEIEKMKAEAEANAEADKKEREKIDKLNQADSMIFTTENQLKELGDKLPADKKAPIEAALQKLKDAHKAQDLAAVDTAMAELNTAFQAASAEMYAQSGAQGGAQAGPDMNAGQAGGAQDSGKHGDNVQDADFEEVK